MKGRVGRGLLALVSGAALGQLILVGSTPILSRLYGTAAFGGFSALVAVTSVIGPAAALKFDVGVILPESENEARRLVRLAILATLFVSCATGMVLWALGPTTLGWSWRMVPLAPLWGAALVFATSVFTILTQAALRERNYGVVARRPVFQSLGTATAQVGLGLFGAEQVGLTGGFVVGRFFGFLPLIKVTWPLLGKPVGGSYVKTLREYSRLPTALTGAALLNALGSNIPLLVIAGAFGDSAAGEYGMAQRLITVPATLLGATAAQVIGAELASLLREQRTGAREIYLKTTVRLGVVGALVGIAVAALAPLLPIILGAAWAGTVQLAQAMAAVAAVALVGSPLSQVYTVYQSRMTVLVDTIRILLILAAAGVAFLCGFSLVETAWALSVAQVVGYVLLWWYGHLLVIRQESLVQSDQ